MDPLNSYSVGITQQFPYLFYFNRHCILLQSKEVDFRILDNHKKLLKQNRLTTWKLQCTIPVFNVNRSPNEAGSITEIIDVILHYKGHTEHTSFAVTSLGKQEIILGFTWLQEHNLEIDWWTWEVVMSQCPARCHMCQSEAWKECQECQRVEWLIQTCCSGPHPLLSEEESEADSAPDSDMISNSTSAPPLSWSSSPPSILM